MELKAQISALTEELKTVRQEMKLCPVSYTHLALYKFEFIEDEKMKIGDIIYEESANGQVKTSMLENYMRVAGVWALFGKENKSSKYKCLNVGATSDVGYEILYDIGCLHFLGVRKDGTNNYINQFHEDCGLSLIHILRKANPKGVSRL